ncbi:DUF177 domain-containing protein [Chitinimonas sp. BJYL2]|uniref:YceD family protein n=1 Tax=Chitinimonas sp. BJYL2 TaxID=2976696 RepID=UPI0022B5A623|nr:YceD family protein [Chitinimonas sp. BJYL2]
MSDLIFDNGEFARQGKSRRGELPLSKLERVQADVISGSAVHYALAGSMDHYKRPVLDLALGGELQLRCHRCLKPMDFELDVTARFTLFGDEAKLETAEAEEDELEGLMFDRDFDLQNLIEDEILLSLPYVALHDACAAEAAMDVVEEAPSQRPNPFAVLAELKGKLKRGEQ